MRSVIPIFLIALLVLITLAVHNSLKILHYAMVMGGKENNIIQSIPSSTLRSQRSLLRQQSTVSPTESRVSRVSTKVRQSSALSLLETQPTMAQTFGSAFYYACRKIGAVLGLVVLYSMARNNSVTTTTGRGLSRMFRRIRSNSSSSSSSLPFTTLRAVPSGVLSFVAVPSGCSSPIVFYVSL